ncbi:hypothetical protein PMG11_02863 [Penicillium brasilianum]|uniref:ribonuclease H n=1 Tax=Penicillium brasilianum TaxID=104259 RepID=A0A0F7TNW3_PENBI|nr:hypothetical protein PMG11_02863 [Penicillium brasilianum]
MSLRPRQRFICLILTTASRDRLDSRPPIGVFHGENSRRNVSCTLDSYGRHTNQRAELHACLSALFDALVIQREWEVAVDRLSAIVIKSDSEYVVRGLTEWLPKWKKNGWKSARPLQSLIMPISSRLSS